jgi:hypothetical protein
MNKDGLAWRSKGQSITIIGHDLKRAEWMRLSRTVFQVIFSVTGGLNYKFEGFREAVCRFDLHFRLPMQLLSAISVV